MNIFNPFSHYKKLKKLRNEEPDWVSWFVTLLSIIYFFGSLDLLFAAPFYLIFWLVIGLISSSLCLRLAEENKGSPTLAFGVGFFVFSLKSVE